MTSDTSTDRAARLAASYAKGEVEVYLEDRRDVIPASTVELLTDYAIHVEFAMSADTEPDMFTFLMERTVTPAARAELWRFAETLAR